MDHELTKVRLELRRAKGDSQQQSQLPNPNTETDWAVVVSPKKRPSENADQAEELQAGKRRTPPLRKKFDPPAKESTSPDAIFWGPSTVFKGGNAPSSRRSTRK